MKKTNILVTMGIVLSVLAFTVNSIYLHSQAPAFHEAVVKVVQAKQDDKRIAHNRRVWSKLDGGNWKIPKSWKKDVK